MKCAFYEKQLTPPLGDDIPGYYANRFTEDVADDLYARAVVFSGNDENPADMLVVLTLDACFCEKDLADAIKARVTELAGIPYERIAVIANHTHYGIPHGDSVSIRDEEYMSLLPRLAADAIILAVKRLEKCTLTYGMGHEDRCAFVRDYVFDEGAIVTNPGRKRKDRIVRPYSDPDPDLPVLTAYSESGKPLGVLFTYALHQDTTGGKVFSGDFSSEIARRLKVRYGKDFGSIFVPGYCGDINHFDVLGGMNWNHRSIGRLLSGVIADVSENRSAAVEGENLEINTRTIVVQRRRATPEQIAHCKYVLEDAENRKGPYVMLGSFGYKLTLMYEEYAATLPNNDVEIPLQIMRVGDVWFYVTPCEVYHQYGRPLKEAAPSGKWLISELGNFYGGYIPTPELMGTDIYPAWLCDGSWLETEAGNKMIAALLEMVKEMA